MPAILVLKVVTLKCGRKLKEHGASEVRTAAALHLRPRTAVTARTLGRVVPSRTRGPLAARFVVTIMVLKNAVTFLVMTAVAVLMEDKVGPHAPPKGSQWTLGLRGVGGVTGLRRPLPQNNVDLTPCQVMVMPRLIGTKGIQEMFTAANQVMTDGDDRMRTLKSDVVMNLLLYLTEQEELQEIFVANDRVMDALLYLIQPAEFQEIPAAGDMVMGSLLYLNPLEELREIPDESDMVTDTGDNLEMFGGGALVTTNTGKGIMGSGRCRTGRGGATRTPGPGMDGTTSGRDRETATAEEDVSRRVVGRDQNSAPR